MPAQARGRPALPLSQYGVIGDLRSIALIGSHGSVDWYCLPHLAAPSVFGALLDTRRGGHFRVAPATAATAEQHYLEDTNVLCTRWRAERGVLRVTDFMPLEGSLEGDVPPRIHSELHRLLVCEQGQVEVEVEWAPRLDYARGATRLERVPDGYLSKRDSALLSLGGLPPGAGLADDGEGPLVRARFRLSEGERVALVTKWGGGPQHGTLATCERSLRETVAAWRGWLEQGRRHGSREWAGPHQALITRSELVLKLLTFSDTGAIAAAATTSLPETPGGVRNWDYRYAWIRDAGLAAQALSSLGHRHEARRFIDWAEQVSDLREQQGGRLRIMYGLHGEVELPEVELSHLEGYRGARPVRIGNAAAGQVQHDIYGELLTAAYELHRQGETLSPEHWHFLGHVADEACRRWEEPDDGLWEIRGRRQHYTYSKVLCWAALDRALRLAGQGMLRGNTERWRQSRERLCEVVLREGYNEKRGTFVQAFGSTTLDASNLLIPIQELLPHDDPRVQRTLDATLAHLTENGLVYRYRMDDGLPGEEGAFGLCTFWLVDALALSGRREEAERIFEGMVRRASPLGLYSEQVEPRSGEFLGNLPQAFTHLGLINSALYLAHARGEKLPLPPLIGTPEHRHA